MVSSNLPLALQVIDSLDAISSLYEDGEDYGATCTDPAYLKLLELTNQLVDLTRETMATEGWESVKNSLREAGSPSHHFYLI